MLLLISKKPNLANYKLFFFIFFLLNTLYTSTAQEYQFIPKKNIAKQTRWIEVDQMKHLYLIENDHSLLKYNTEGTLLYQYNENSLGQISYIDVSNPFRILVYYDDYATVVLLDRTLSELKRHDLSDLDIPQVQALATASDNNIWIFDNNSYTLKKVDNQNQTLVESPDLSLLLTETIDPNRLVEYNGRVYLNSPNLGILVFDVFGNYIKTIDVLDLDYFQLYEGQLFYVENNEFKSYHLLSFQTKKISIPTSEKKLQQVCIVQNFIYQRSTEEIQIFHLKRK